jgi:hypothetical protein
MLLGTSNRKYPMENRPAIRPNWVGVMPRFVHLQRCVADVRAVDEGDDVKQHEERDDPLFDLADDVRPVGEYRSFWGCGHDSPMSG